MGLPVAVGLSQDAARRGRLLVPQAITGRWPPRGCGADDAGRASDLGDPGALGVAAHRAARRGDLRPLLGLRLLRLPNCPPPPPRRGEPPAPLRRLRTRTHPLLGDREDRTQHPESPQTWRRLAVAY